MIQYIQITCESDRLSEVVGQTYKIFLRFLPTFLNIIIVFPQRILKAIISNI